MSEIVSTILSYGLYAICLLAAVVVADFAGVLYDYGRDSRKRKDGFEFWRFVRMHTATAGDIAQVVTAIFVISVVALELQNYLIELAYPGL